MKSRIITALVGFSSLLLGCTDAGSQSPELSKAFQGYWFSGKAEVTSYELKQARYGEMRKGKAVMIFVTEPFSESKHVKLDQPKQAGKDHVDVLKMNFTKDFNTGVYPYHVMTSVFTPLNFTEYKHSLKITNSVTEWCGQAFSQMDYRAGMLDLKQYSYFESDGDLRSQPGTAMMEDEIWNLIRINPELIPKGETEIIPALSWCRMLHQEVKPKKANIRMENKGVVNRLTLTYPGMARELRIDFSAAFPHDIEYWEEDYIDGWGKLAKKLTTSGKRLHKMNIDYWNLNGNPSEELRSVLGLDK